MLPGSEDRGAVSSLVPHIARIRRLFPERADHVARLALKDETFRGLCEDYGMALEALFRLELRNHPLDVERLVEYRTLIRDLEQELREELGRTDPCAKPNAGNGGTA